VWKKAMRNQIAQTYGLLVSIIDSGELHDPAKIDLDEYDLENDPHGLTLHKVKAAITNRERLISNSEADAPKCHALIWKYLSSESQEAVLGHADYNEELHLNDCLQLALSVEATHQGGGGAADDVTRRTNARDVYGQVKQGPTESIADYK